jgi:hypothetical protein
MLVVMVLLADIASVGFGGVTRMPAPVSRLSGGSQPDQIHEQVYAAPIESRPFSRRA